MVIKSLSRKSGTRQLINYLFEDKKKLSSEKFKPLTIRHNVRSRSSVDKLTKEFEANEALRIAKRKDAVKVYHTIISFGQKDKGKITEPMLRDFALKYIELQGKDNMYLITQHVEKEHIHLHCVMSGTKYQTGIANRLSKSEFSHLKTAMQTFQKEKYPALTNSLPVHGNGKQTEYLRDIKLSQKLSLEIGLQKAYHDSKSLPDFLRQIKILGHEPYYRNEKLTGIKYEGEQKFRLSRLGYDANKMKALEHRDNEENQHLAELDDLRNERSNSREAEEKRSRERNLNDEDTDKEEVKMDNEPDDDDTR